MGLRAQPSISVLNAPRKDASRIVMGSPYESAAFSQRLTKPSRASSGGLVPLCAAARWKVRKGVPQR